MDRTPTQDRNNAWISLIIEKKIEGKPRRGKPR